MSTPPRAEQLTSSDDPSPDRLLLIEWVALGFIVAYLAFLAFSGLEQGHIHNGDSDFLVQGTSEALDCISKGIWIECGLIRGTLHTEIGPYPILQ